jgi:hypothetical protein
MHDLSELDVEGAPAAMPRVRLALLAWILCVGAGFAVLWSYAQAPGIASAAPETWPAETALVRATDRATLVMFVHPHCGCSRASLAELQRLMRRVGERASVQLVFVRPPGVPNGWEQTDLRAQAESIGGVRVVDDHDGVEAGRFAAQTSGASMLYDADGVLMFAGGITAVRGHEGESLGQERIVALLRSETVDRADSPVFGCALESPTTDTEEASP